MSYGAAYMHGATGDTLYMTVVSADSEIWNGTEFESLLVANWAAYAIEMLENQTSAIYMGIFPMADKGHYLLTIYKQLGGVPATTDTVLESEIIDWDGGEEITQTRIDHKVDDNQAFIIAK